MFFLQEAFPDNPHFLLVLVGAPPPSFQSILYVSLRLHLPVFSKFIPVGFVWLPRWHSAKEFACQPKRQVQSLGGEYSLEQEMATIPAFLPGKFHEQRRLVGYGSWVTKSWTQLSLHMHTHAHTHSLPRGLRIFEGNDSVLFSFFCLWQSAQSLTHSWCSRNAC